MHVTILTARRVMGETSLVALMAAYMSEDTLMLRVGAPDKKFIKVHSTYERLGFNRKFIYFFIENKHFYRKQTVKMLIYLF